MSCASVYDIKENTQMLYWKPVYFLYCQTSRKHVHKERTKLIVLKQIFAKYRPVNSENIAFGSVNWMFETEVLLNRGSLENKFSRFFQTTLGRMKMLTFLMLVFV